MIARGVDMFDCVMPTRLARHGVALTPDGPMHIKISAGRRIPAQLTRRDIRMSRNFPALTCGICLKPVKYSL